MILSTVTTMTSRSCHLIVWLRSVASLKTVSLIRAFINISTMWYLETSLCSMMESKMFSLTKQNRQEKWEQGSCSQRLSSCLYCLRSYPAFHVSDFPCNVLARPSSSIIIYILFALVLVWSSWIVCLWRNLYADYIVESLRR